MGWYQRRVHGECGLVTKSGNMRASLVVLGVLAASHIGHSNNITDTRGGKAFSLFSIVQFPNQQCTASSSSTTYGTCYTSSECTSKGGSSDGNCAAGFGVCCVITSSTCSTTINTNTTYIRNPSSYTPSTTGTCAFTFSKISDDICQLRLDFQTFSGFATTTPIGACSDYMTAAGQTGKDPPSICGTNTDYHMYVEFGATSTDFLHCFLQSSHRLRPVLHRHRWQCEELQLRWRPDSGGAAVQQLHQNGEGILRHPVEGVLHHLARPLQPGQYHCGGRQWAAPGPRLPVRHRLHCHPQPQPRRRPPHPSSHRIFPSLPVSTVRNKLRNRRTGCHLSSSCLAPAAICAGSVHCCTRHCSLSRRNYRLQLGLHSDAMLRQRKQMTE